MPQNNYLTMFQSTYPILAPVQKPPGVTVSTTATAPRVPNKFTYSAGTIQMYDPETGLLKELAAEKIKDKLEDKVVAEPKKPVEEEPEEDDDGDDDDTSGTVKRTVTRTTTRRR